MRDERGNLERTNEGGFVTKVLRDKEGKAVPEGTPGAKYTDEYNCEDFGTRGEAQMFFTNAGGIGNDTNRLDGDKDGEACESLSQK
ncbi:MAG: excalibur calcium-binding domain-containing protein [Candidatus Moraniibacteriota bacterium]|nr:MAG: excalibur calcium-binding domain-containing protein [Candidatus Moranbacteria bacterium]